MYLWGGEEVLGDEEEHIEFYEHVLYINLQLSTNAYQNDNTLVHG